MGRKMHVNIAIKVAKTHDCSQGFWRTVLEALEFYKTFKNVMEDDKK